MNLKVATKYRLCDSKRSILIFYVVILSVLALMFLFSALTNDNVDLQGSIQGMELASAIFLFVVGLNSFKEVFMMFMQNGISRKTMFISNIISTFAICGIMALIDSILAFLGRSITVVNGGIYSKGVLELMYGHQINGVRTLLLSIFLCFFIYITFTGVGFFTTTLYYRMNKVQKITLSICIPALLFVILPIVDTVLFQGVIFSVIAKITGAAFINPFLCMLSCFILFGLFTALSYLLVKNVVAKD